MEERFKVDIMYRECLSWLAPDLVHLCFIASTRTFLYTSVSTWYRRTCARQEVCVLRLCVTGDTRCSPKGLMEIVSLSREEVHSINKSHRNERFVSSAKLLQSIPEI